MYSLRKAARTKRSLKVAGIYRPRLDHAAASEASVTAQTASAPRSDTAINPTPQSDARKSTGDT